jgi:glucose-1-phosphate adenylyltransferase
MGIYVFDWKILKEYLVMDEKDPKSSNDFGKNVIPKMLEAGEKMFAYKFKGYWKDVGTVQSLWEANMDLVASPPLFNLENNYWKILSRNPVKPPHYAAPGARIISSCITEGCNIYGNTEHSVIFEGVTIEKDAIVKDSVILPNVRICRGAVVEKAVIGTGAVIGRDARIGLEDNPDNQFRSDICTDGIVLVKGGIIIGEGAQIYKNSMVSSF